MAKLLLSDEFSDEVLGIHFLRGHWAPESICDSESHSRHASLERVWQGARDNATNVKTTYGCPEAAGIVIRATREWRVSDIRDTSERGEEVEELTVPRKKAWNHLIAIDGCWRCSDESDESQSASFESSDGDECDDSEGELDTSVFRCPDETDSEVDVDGDGLGIKFGGWNSWRSKPKQGGDSK